MKIRFSLFALLVGALFLVATEALTSTSGSPVGRTGSPSSFGTCATAGCHSGPSVTTQSVSITSDIPASGFLENTDYTITVTADANGASSSKIGFSASLESTAGFEGSVSSINNQVKRIGTSQYVTHTSGGTSAPGGSRSWSFKWNSGTAPDQTRIYTAVNFSNSNSAASGDVITTQQLVLNKDQSVALNEFVQQDLSVYPNPATDFVNLRSAEPIGRIRLFDLSGKLVMDQIIADDSRRIEIGHLPRGQYLLFDSKGLFVQSISLK